MNNSYSDKLPPIENIVYMLALRNESRLIIRAAEIQAGMWNDVPKEMLMDVYKSKCSPDQQSQFSEGERTMKIWCPIIACDPYRMDGPFLVKWPNGQSDWVSDTGAKQYHEL